MHHFKQWIFSQYDTTFLPYVLMIETETLSLENLGEAGPSRPANEPNMEIQKLKEALKEQEAETSKYLKLYKESEQKRREEIKEKDRLAEKVKQQELELADKNEKIEFLKSHMF